MVRNRTAVAVAVPKMTPPLGSPPPQLRDDGRTDHFERTYKSRIGSIRVAPDVDAATLSSFFESCPSFLNVCHLPVNPHVLKDVFDHTGREPQTAYHVTHGKHAQCAMIWQQKWNSSVRATEGNIIGEHLAYQIFEIGDKATWCKYNIAVVRAAVQQPPSTDVSNVFKEIYKHNPAFISCLGIEPSKYVWQASIMVIDPRKKVDEHGGRVGGLPYAGNSWCRLLTSRHFMLARVVSRTYKFPDVSKWSCAGHESEEEGMCDVTSSSPTDHNQKEPVLPVLPVGARAVDVTESDDDNEPNSMPLRIREIRQTAPDEDAAQKRAQRKHKGVRGIHIFCGIHRSSGASSARRGQPRQQEV